MLSGRDHRSGRRAAFATLAVGLICAPAAHAAAFDTSLVSRAAAPGASANEPSEGSDISADGRFVAFTSSATNLPDDTDTNADVFVHDRQTGQTVLVSRANGPDGASAAGAASVPSISADGRYVAFAANTTDLGGTDGIKSIYLRDLQQGTTELVSRTEAGAQARGDDPSIAGDGSAIAFESADDDISDDDTNGFSTDVYVLDRDTDVTSLVGRAGDGAAATAGSENPSISGDGSRVAFASRADNLSTSDSDNTGDVFVRELSAQTTELVSRPATGNAEAGANSSEPSLSADGRYVAFMSGANNLGEPGGPGATDVFVHDLAGDSTTLASRASGAAGDPGNAFSYEPSISGDGRYVAFASDATNFDGQEYGVFVRDRTTGTTARADRGSGEDGALPNNFSDSPEVAGSAPFVAFESFATNLDPTPVPAGERQVYVRQFAALPASGGGGGAPPAGSPFPLQPVRDDLAPRLSGLSASRATFAVGSAATPVSAKARKGTTLRYRVSEAAVVRFTFEQRTKGRRSKGRCRPQTRGNRRNRACVRYVKRGSLWRNRTQAGPATLAFSGRIGRRALRPGSYRVGLVAVDRAGNRSPVRYLRFRIVRR